MGSDLLEDESASPSLEIVELELALRHQNFLELGFEGAVRQALERVGGELLFRMRMDGVSGYDWLAAVALDSDGGRKLALVAQPTDGGPLRIEDAETSDMTIARVAIAYADVVKSLRRLS
ncbi:hypothetical protein [Chelativorans sp. AA-79]|uniref:hypothetical protein n=1 Tax=Chelativorans sp. AA-79 TaxID=3028735 RepID=UPI0023F73C63|nr:hypothetical protein [Chelativorans sp. AA-79]WEX07803.1 hypothetical protein PVE73_17090 [Chelativorans sp. AA-79]